MIPAVVLAAGLSRRMGRFKLTLPWGKTTVIGQVIAVLETAGLTHIIVVTGHRAEEVTTAIAGTAARTVHNPDYATGEMLSSIQTGLREVVREAHVPAGADEGGPTPAEMTGTDAHDAVGAAADGKQAEHPERGEAQSKGRSGRSVKVASFDCGLSPSAQDAEPIFRADARDAVGATGDENPRSDGFSRAAQPGATACPGGQAREVAATKGYVFRAAAFVPAVLLCLGDQPQMEVATVRALLAAGEAEGWSRIVIPSYRMRAGHPILLPAWLWPEVLACTGILRDVLAKHRDATRYLEVDTPSILADLDAPEDYEAGSRKLEGG